MATFVDFDDSGTGDPIRSRSRSSDEKTSVRRLSDEAGARLNGEREGGTSRKGGHRLLSLSLKIKSTPQNRLNEVYTPVLAQKVCFGV